MWYARSSVVLSLLLIIVLLTAVLVRTPVTGRDGDPRLLSTSTAPLGAALFYDLAGRLGFAPRRATSPITQIEAGAIVTELDPVLELTPSDVHVLLQHVRSGGALLAVLGRSTKPLSDSISITIDPRGAAIDPRQGAAHPCESSAQGSPVTPFSRNGLWFGPAMLLGLHVRDSLHRARQTFVYLAESVRGDTTGTQRPAMVGLPYGRGRIVVAGDPDVLRNDALRNCSYGLDVAVVAALEYLRDGAAVARRTIIFDDYHLRRIAPIGAMGVVQGYLAQTASGRMLLQVIAAGLLWLLATAPRVLPPRHDQRIERRSPLEHVDALARAYAQVGATRTGVMRLLRGCVRRVGGAGRGTTRQHDDLFLAQAKATAPSLADDVKLVRHALAHTVTRSQFIEVGNAIARIEHTLTHS